MQPGAERGEGSVGSGSAGSGSAGDHAGPAWMQALGERAGPLLVAATRFLHAHRLTDMPPGAEGLAELCRVLVTASGEPGPGEDDDVDRRFIEGAGAVLAMIVLAHWPTARHTCRDGAHRVRLGAHGFFDPFTAIERAWDAPAPRCALADALAEAEAEAAGHGPLSRVVHELVRQLAAAGSPLRITAQHDARLWLGDDVEIDLGRIVTATREATAADVAASVRRLVAALTGDVRGATLPWSEARARLLPRLVNPQLTRGLPTRDATHPLHIRTVCEGLAQGLVLAFSGRARYVRTAEIETWGVSPGQAHGVAIANLAARSERTRWQRHDTGAGDLLVARSGDGLDASRLLLPDLHAHLIVALGLQASEPVWVGAPHRDCLLACAPTRRLARHARAYVRDQARRAQHRISEALFVLHGPGRIEPWHD